LLQLAADAQAGEGQRLLQALPQRRGSTGVRAVELARELPVERAAVVIPPPTDFEIKGS
jgi:hypothetical protein